MIKVKLKKVYGRIYFKPANDMAKAICELINRKSVTDKAAKILNKHNIKIEIQEENDDS